MREYILSLIRHSLPVPSREALRHHRTGNASSHLGGESLPRLPIGAKLQVFTDHSAVKAVLETPAPTASTLGGGPRSSVVA